MCDSRCRRNHSSLRLRRIESDAEHRCRNNCCRRNHSPLASIPKSGLEIKNRCTLEVVNGEKLASIRKFGLEIKNRCMQQAIFSTRSLDESLWRHVGGVPKEICVDACSTVAAKAGADAPGGGISLCFCRRGCAAPAYKAATLNVLPRSSPRRHGCCRRNHSFLPRRKSESDAEHCCGRTAATPAITKKG